MYLQIKCFASYANSKLNKRIGQRGAEMVEYAIVLACIAAVAMAFYIAAKGEANGHKGWGTLNGVLTDCWDLISDTVDAILK